MYTWALGDFSLAPKGCASSSGHRLIDREPKRSSNAAVNLWSFVEIQPPRVSCDISRGVAYPRSGDLVWLASIGGASLFASASFHSSCGSLVVGVSTKTVVKGARYYHDSAPLMVKLAR
ncbi:hypothetical protein GW17_00031541 [Ensete ventricosum]|nr:hypothetical protein GW17_00031541 [Ensete ventricosum]